MRRLLADIDAKALWLGFIGLFLMGIGAEGIRFVSRSVVHFLSYGVPNLLILAWGLGFFVIGFASILLALLGIAWQVALGMAVWDSWNMCPASLRIVKNEPRDSRDRAIR